MKLVLLENYYQEAAAMLKYHEFECGHTANTINWHISGSQEIRVNDGGFIHVVIKWGTLTQTHYKKDLRLLENVIFFYGLNKQFSKRVYQKYADIEMHKNIKK